DDRRRIDLLVKQLGDDEFETREAASKALPEYGVAALAALRKAKDSRDPEVRRRVRELLPALERVAALERPGGLPLVGATVRLLLHRKTPGAVETLLRYLPFTNDPAVEEEIY